MNKPYRFDLDKALAAWRRNLEHNRAFSRDDLDELEQHLRDQITGLMADGLCEEAAFSQAMHEMGDYSTAEAEYRKVYWGKVRRRHLLLSELIWRLSMFKNYLKIALRNTRRHAGYSAINIGGLVVGMTCCLLIAFYVREELSYDRHHADHERVYRVALRIETATSTRVFANGPATLAPALRETYPQVEETVRLWKRSGQLVSQGLERQFYEDNFFFADPSVFNIFDLPLAQGTAESALAQPTTVVISARITARYFGEENPMGQILTIGNDDYEVSGVLQERTHNSHITFDFIASILPIEERFDWFQSWHLTMFHTYVKLRENADTAAFAADVENLAERYVANDLKEFQQEYHYYLQPIAGIHLHSQLNGEIEPPGNVLYIYIFAAVAILILLIASLNYINLTTAQSATRAKEVGMRKVVGARHSQLVKQFLSESVGVAAVALVLTLGLVALALPWFNAFTGYRLHVAQLVQPDVLLGLTALLICTGVLAGLFPALVLSAMHPVRTLKGSFSKSGSGVLLRKMLVISQFAISLILIAGSLTAFQQLTYMKDSNLGFDAEQMLVVPTRGLPLADHFEQIKSELLTASAIRSVTASSAVPGRNVDNFSIQLNQESDSKNQSMYYLFTDFDFLETYDVEMVAGRALQEELATDQESAVMLNEAGLHAFGWQTPEEALGQQVVSGFGGRQSEIVGVYRNFNYRSLHAEVDPLIIMYAPSRFAFLSLKLGTADLSATIAGVEQLWKRFFPDRPFEYFFVDENFNRQYQADERTALLLLIFASLAILIACLGLLGLAAFSAQEYQKEIGIRKVLGATVGSVVVLMTRGFAKLMLVAVLVGMPVAWFVIDRWLKHFAYRIEVPWMLLLLAGFLVLLIAVLTVSYQSIKAALADPVKSLRYE